jgi:hypothetical protein
LIVGDPSTHFDPSGIETLAQFSELEATPTALTLAQGHLYFLRDAELWSLDTAAGPSSPAALVHGFSSAPAGLAFDGNDTLFACDPSSGLFALSISAVQEITPAVGHVDCVHVAASQDRLIFDVAATFDGGEVVAFGGINDGGVSRVTTDPSQVALGVDGEYAFAAVLPKIRRLSSDGRLCGIAQIGNTPLPKVMAVSQPDAGGVIIARGRSGALRYVDEDAPCCEGPLGQPDAQACSSAPTSPVIVSTDGDFTVSGGNIYWSTGDVIRRQEVASLRSDAGVQTVLTSGGGTISSVAADDTWVYFVLGPRVLRGRLPN